MCVLFLALGAHPLHRVVLAANRDETHARPTAPAHRWPETAPDGTALFGGRDEVAGGTWFGVSADGVRWASVTNVRDAQAVAEARSADPPVRPSRGELPLGYLTSGAAPEAYARDVFARRSAYAGFNLLLGDGDTVWYVSTHTDAPEPLAPGLYGLSNATLNVRWPKVSRGLRLFRRRLQNSHEPLDELLPLWSLLADEERPGDSVLPETGVGLEAERFLSPIFIRGEDYGTRASLVFLRDADGRGLYAEKRFGPAGAPLETTLFRLG